ncbi:hypothetical protein CWB76_13085 [Pseudoalteromonas sp. S1609]|uniref:hypothetical protein n=1 Tax=Pseudoalteromonas sp. S1609 TaxID=579505 RepID=UPI00110A9D81|nr:hypothetical protein [Pseudoalteromonas sp. S1609]TMP69495.1 hypothetical protein CWB76_13085 [Pseudoalteromonas sp. S1609]
MKKNILFLYSLLTVSAPIYAEPINTNGSVENVIEELNNQSSYSDNNMQNLANIVAPPYNPPLMGCTYKIKTIHKSSCNYVALAQDVTNPFTGEIVRKIGSDVRLRHTKEDSQWSQMFGRDNNYRKGEVATGRQISGEPTQCAIGPQYFRANTVFYKYINGRIAESKRVYYTAEYHLEAYPNYTSTPYYEDEKCFY